MRLTAIALLLFPASALAGVGAPTLEIDGWCPGRIDVNISGATPGGTYTIIYSDELGSDPIPFGRCEGVATGLTDGRWAFNAPDIDGDGAISFNPPAPERACGQYLQVIATSSCLTSEAVRVGSDLPDNPECTDYVELSDSFRNVTYPYDYARCDSGLFGWFRLTGDAGTMMPETAPDTYSCGTHAPGWLNGAHPATPGETALVENCWHWSSGTCFWTHFINVTNCGDFYVYEANGLPFGCSGTYCGEDI